MGQGLLNSQCYYHSPRLVCHRRELGEPENEDELFIGIDILKDDFYYNEFKKGTKLLADDYNRNSLAIKMIGILSNL